MCAAHLTTGVRATPWGGGGGGGQSCIRVPPYFASSDAILAIASEETEEARSCAICTRGGCYVVCLDGRTCLIANSVLYCNNVLHYEVAEDAMKRIT